VNILARPKNDGICDGVGVGVRETGLMVRHLYQTGLTAWGARQAPASSEAEPGRARIGPAEVVRGSMQGSRA